VQGTRFFDWVRNRSQIRRYVGRGVPRAITVRAEVVDAARQSWRRLLPASVACLAGTWRCALGGLPGHAWAVDETDPGGAMGDQFVKVVFELARDEDGWPPAASEGLWAVPVSPDVVRLDNTPFFARGVAADDLIRVRREADGRLRAAGLLEWSGHCTIRIIVFRDGQLGGSRQQVLDMFAPLGATGEGIERYAMVALDIPPDAEIAAIRRLLLRGQRDGWWDYEEGCIGPAWQAAGPG
jgi:Domain of unknown function (DUF4265)